MDTLSLRGLELAIAPAQLEAASAAIATRRGKRTRRLIALSADGVQAAANRLLAEALAAAEPEAHAGGREG